MSSSLSRTPITHHAPPPPQTTNNTGFKLVGLKLYQTPESVAKEHYKDLASKPFYPALVEYIVSGPVVAMVWEGDGVVASARKLIGATNPLAAEPGTIRGDLAVEVGRNVVHGSDSPENGERETGELLFGGEGSVLSRAALFFFGSHPTQINENNNNNNSAVVLRGHHQVGAHQRPLAARVELFCVEGGVERRVARAPAPALCALRDRPRSVLSISAVQRGSLSLFFGYVRRSSCKKEEEWLALIGEAKGAQRSLAAASHLARARADADTDALHDGEERARWTLLHDHRNKNAATDTNRQPHARSPLPLSLARALSQQHTNRGTTIADLSTESRHLSSRAHPDLTERKPRGTCCRGPPPPWGGHGPPRAASR